MLVENILKEIEIILSNHFSSGYLCVLIDYDTFAIFNL